MDGIHDMGGMAGFGEITVEGNEPVFHKPWQGHAFAMNILSIGVIRAYNADEYRHALERMLPFEYLNASYYERVLTGVASLLIEKGIVEKDDLDSRVDGYFPLAQANADVSDDGNTTQEQALFKLGEQVRVKDLHVNGHTRVPRYVRGCKGEIVRVAPYFSYPDAAAHGLPFRKEPTYHVLFKTSEIWHDNGVENETVVVDLWESYLESAS